MENYDDIIHLPHHRSKKRSHMSAQDRAAQFSPFAALTGFDAAIEETGRLTDCRPELLDHGMAQLDQALTRLMELIPLAPLITATYFIEDDKKSGGHCESITGQLQKIDLYRKTLTFTDGRQICLGDILHIESPEVVDPAEP